MAVKTIEPTATDAYRIKVEQIVEIRVIATSVEDAKEKAISFANSDLPRTNPWTFVSASIERE